MSNTDKLPALTGIIFQIKEGEFKKQPNQRVESYIQKINI